MRSGRAHQSPGHLLTCFSPLRPDRLPLRLSSMPRLPQLSLFPLFLHALFHSQPPVPEPPSHALVHSFSFIDDRPHTCPVHTIATVAPDSMHSI